MYNPMSISYIRNKENITFQIILKLRILYDLSNYNLTNINSYCKKCYKYSNCYIYIIYYI